MICLLFFSMTLSIAEMWAAESKSLIVELQNGSQTTFVLSEKPEMTFANHVLTIVMNNKSSDFEISDVKQFYFGEISSDIQQLKVNELKIVYQSDDKVVIEGASESDRIVIYSIKGVMQKAAVSFDGEKAEVSLSSLPKGTYIVNVQNKQSFKIIKK